MHSLRHYALFVAVFLLVTSFISCDARITGLMVSPETYDYKFVRLGDSQPYYFKLSNQSDENFQVSGLTFLGLAAEDFSITMGGATPFLIQPRKTHLLTIEFAPKEAGLRYCTLRINHNGPSGFNEIELKGTGLAVPRISVSNPTFDYGVVYVTRTKSHDFVFENVGTSKLVINSILLDGSNANLYDFPNGTNTPILTDPGQTHTLTVDFTPKNDGKFPVTLKIFHNAINEDNPFEIPIDAEGVTYAPEIELDKTSPMNYGTAPIGYPVFQDIKLTSKGIDPLTIASATITNGTSFNIMSIVDDTGNPVALPQTYVNGKYIVIRVEFDPVASAKYDDTLTILHDGINEPTPLEIKLEGEGKTAVTQNFSYTGSAQNFTVPAGIHALRVVANGAGGGGTTGGKGGKIVGTVSVSPGEVYNVIVGGKGNNASYNRSASGGGGFTGLLDSNGNHVISAGGAGGCAGTDPSSYGSGGDGGGGNGSNGPCGNGGNGGVNGPSAAGGAGGLSGGNPGQPGTATGGGNGGNGVSNQASGGGGGGYGTAKGIGGTQHTTSGKGGDGGFGGGGGGGGGGWGSTYSRLSAGGGGGGGYSGGDGGQAPSGCGSPGGGGGGGGGSNYGDPAITNVISDEKGQGAARGTNGSLTLIY